MSFLYATVLTGSIATGKSSVSTMLKERGFEIIDADKITHKILDTHVTDIGLLFGKEYIKDGKVIRNKLGTLIFTDKDQRKKLEDFLHPLIKEEIEDKSKKLDDLQKPYIVDIPLFFEKKNYAISDVCVVYCTKEQQLQRLRNRNSLNKDEAQKRINTQIDIDKKKELASFVIDNTKDLAHLKDEVDRFEKYINNKRQ
jgi:dephospho-CoA kinase